MLSEAKDLLSSPQNEIVIPTLSSSKGKHLLRRIIGPLR